jgi:xanthine dehydrogenase iron-sulfur cluster and FAD-binding subunit A
VDHFSKDQAKTIRQLRQIKQAGFQFISNEQVYHRPLTLAEALQLKKKYPRAIVICGATDIALKVTKLKQKIPVILDLSGLEEIRGIRKFSKFMRFGAGHSLQEVKTFTRTKFPALFDMLNSFGSLQIRNIATIGGNIGSASPVGDCAPLLSAYQASVVLRSKRGERKVLIDDFIRGYRETDLKADELIFAIDIPFQQSDEIIKFYKISKRRDLDISTVSAGFRLKLRANHTVEDIGMTYGGMAEMTRRASVIEKFLRNKVWNKVNVEEALDLLDKEFTPINDARADAAGRIISAKNLILKFWYDTQLILADAG